MMNHPFDVTTIRQQFPALQQRSAQGNPYIYFDGPGGTQVPQTVISAMSHYLITANANHEGHFITSQLSDQLIDEARVAMADFFNAPSPQEIVFGQNMTSLTFNLSRAMGQLWQPGDEIIVTRLDHDANIAPWIALAEQGLVIRWLDFTIEDTRLNLEQFATLLNPKTKLVAVGYASNAVGTINPIKQMTALAHEVGAWVWVDAVHYAPHGPIDVQDLGCDFLVCSAYKFFGPHVGILWGRLELLEELTAYKVRPASPHPPGKFETGTQNHEGIAGITAAITYLASLGEQYGEPFADQLAHYDGRRRALKQAMTAIMAYEQATFTTLLTELQTIRGVTVYGITDPSQFAERCPTVAFTKTGHTPAEIATYLGAQSIFVWDGHYYAISVMEQLGLGQSGGAVRVGLAHYNTSAEVTRLLTSLRRL